VKQKRRHLVGQIREDVGDRMVVEPQARRRNQRKA